MKRFSLLAITAALALPTALNAGIPNSKDSKWMQIDPITASRSGLGNWFIDTEDVEIKGSKLRFWVERTQGKNEPADGNMSLNWTGKYRVDCDAFTSSLQYERTGGFGFHTQNLGKIRKSLLSYALADHFCFLTNSPGYTPVANPPQWVKKIIQTVQSQ